uniref:Uncharacterized protein LOC100369835 n=1 Tax=Saccoglossus kowalevskii TaxID=10224 RepID=A0ABM0GWZ7_SACKO|nr:PREDICTED: uncharacterized protein LOC100369835 [Saccoglossus kowalevskii]
MKEVKLGHTIGPFSEPPFLNFVTNSLGIRPKKTGGHRLIMDLSQPTNNSVNDFIPKENYTLVYARVDDAIAMINKHGPGSLLAKVDIQHAFRLCPVRKQDWHLLGYKWDGHYYFDRVLPFGLRSAPFLFNRIATALEWVVRHQAKTSDIIHYLDDFLAVGPPNHQSCQRSKDIILNTCSTLGIPVAANKVEGPSSIITFLGVELDTVDMVIRLPADKLENILSTIPLWANRYHCSKRELLSLIGTLSFACKCVPAGRLFLRRMIDLATTASSINQIIILSNDFRLDLQWWWEFLPNWNGSARILATSWCLTPNTNLYTDASSVIACGAFYNKQWFTLPWSPDKCSINPPLSIEWKELFPILISCLIWGHLWHGQKIMFHCDNEGIVNIWKKGSSRCQRIMSLVRAIFFTAANGNFHVMIAHIRGTNNSIADSLSRLQMKQFRQLVPDAATEPVTLPDLDSYYPQQ